MMKTVTIIGAGNVGTTLAILLTQHNYVIQEICSGTRSSAERLHEIIGSDQVDSDVYRLTPLTSV
ncbi:NAD(P)-binding domain-containing protein [Granulicella sibirica]|uniref:NAD(P)-binding domain-containing protein n=1 Tax=Granulicella sibirica TaxID=2479048 RepID=UPI003BA87615